MLSFKLLGQVSLSKNGTPLSQFRSQKEAALLIYLAHSGEVAQRDFIADLLWESSSTKQALSNLRTALARLRKQVGDDVLIVTRKTVELAPANHEDVDSAVLLRSLTRSSQLDSAENALLLEQALDNYHGNFLAGFKLSSAPRFNEWMGMTREYIRSQVIGAYDKLSRYLSEQDELEQAITVTKRWLQVDALDETAHTLLLKLLIDAGNLREASAHYDYCVDLLRTELGVEPAAGMTALIKEVKLQKPKPAAPSAAFSQPTPHLPSATRHNLPIAYDQFFGRHSVQQEIQIRLDQPWCRLVTIVGQGGVGKTRLGTTLARNRLSQYRDGVWMIELANIDSDDDDLAEALVFEIATELDLRLSGSAKPADQLIDHLQHKQMMLFLDNFEHLLAGDGKTVDLILDIIQRCEQIQLLVTTREALKIRPEWTIILTGLSYPPNDADEVQSDAVDLFMARRAQQQRKPSSADELAAIRAICRAVEGLPLALELAAALTRNSTAQAVLDSLQNGYDQLTTSMRDVPQRHQGLHIVFEMSWVTLPVDLQEKLAQLSVFRGGFTQVAAQDIADSEEQHLTDLFDKSLLRFHEGNGRYTFHPVIQAYAAAKRSDLDPAATEITTEKHSRYYLDLLAQHTQPLQKQTPQASMAIIEPDIDNVRQAWQAGLALQETSKLMAGLTSLSIYYQLRGLAYEGESVMEATGSDATAWGNDGRALAVRAGLERARFQNRLGRHRPAIQTIQTALPVAIKVADRWAEGMGHVLWGEALWRLGEYESAKKKLNHALKFAHALDDTLIFGWCHHHLGIINDIQSQYDTAQEHLQHACDAWRKLDNAQILSNSLNSVGVVYYHQGKLEAAKIETEKALALCEQVDNRHLQASMLNNLSTIATEQGDFEGAQYYLTHGRNLAIVSGDLYNQGIIQMNIGKTYRYLGENDAAVESIEQGLKISELIGDRSLMASALLNLAEVKREQNHSEQSTNLFDHALKIAQQNNLQHLECEVLIGMAELLSKTNPVKAKQNIIRALSMTKVVQNPVLLRRIQTIEQFLNLSEDVSKTEI